MDVRQPTSIDEALAVLAGDPEATVLAGGTDLMVAVNEGSRTLTSVVVLRDVADLARVQVDGTDVVIGAGTTYTEMMRGPIAKSVPALAAAARTVGSPQIRNAGTLGGNLATASPAGDTLPVLVALNAAVELARVGASRTLPITEFLVGPKRTVLQPGELVTSVRVPMVRGAQDYLKVGVRNAMVIAVASLALVVDFDRARIGLGLGSVGPTALTARDAADWLTDRLEWHTGGVALPDDADRAEFARRVAAECAAIDDHRSTAAYRTHAVEVMASRALRRALSPPAAPTELGAVA